MTRNTKKMLKRICKLASKTEKKLWLNNDGTKIDVNDIDIKALDINDFYDEREGILISLAEEGYIRYKDTEIMPKGEFTLTQKGIHWQEERFKKGFLYFLQKFLVPIIVSVITTLITIYLKNG